MTALEAFDATIRSLEDLKTLMYSQSEELLQLRETSRKAANVLNRSAHYEKELPSKRLPGQPGMLPDANSTSGRIRADIRVNGPSTAAEIGRRIMVPRGRVKSLCWTMFERQALVRVAPGTWDLA
jgi:hypothetical protein